VNHILKVQTQKTQAMVSHWRISPPIFLQRNEVRQSNPQQKKFFRVLCSRSKMSIFKAKRSSGWWQSTSGFAIWFSNPQNVFQPISKKRYFALFFFF